MLLKNAYYQLSLCKINEKNCNEFVKKSSLYVCHTVASYMKNRTLFIIQGKNPLAMTSSTTVISLQSANAIGSRQNMHLELGNSLHRVEKKEKKNPRQKQNAIYLFCIVKLNEAEGISPFPP